MSHRTSPRPLASGLVALVAAGGLLLSGTPAFAADIPSISSSPAPGSPIVPALKPWPDGPEHDHPYYNALLGGESMHFDGGDLERTLRSDTAGSYAFLMQEDGNAVLRASDGRVLFATGTFNTEYRYDPETKKDVIRPNVVILQRDGNLVVEGVDDRPLWASGTDGEPGTTLILGEDGNLALYRQDGTPAWSASAGRIAEPARDTLDTGSSLTFGHRLTSENGLFRAEMQRDGNLVGYGPGGVVWNTDTRGAGNRFVMQDDGNAVLYAADGSVKWATGTSGADLRAVLGDNGVLSLLDEDDTIIWDSQMALPGSSLYGPNDLATGGQLRSNNGDYRTVVQKDGNVVVYGPQGALWSSQTGGVNSSLEIFENGRLQIVADNGAITWSAQPAAGGTAPFRLVMQDDGNLVEYDADGRAVWSIR
ncbi:hypothetical protein HQQ82_03440 [Rathayibacter sp. VKM Ac-2856]|uniref:hypothetical protein n=1 Tax=unclassified Rathayibacter TaxID=2609250 RepID=UPI001565ADFA|nr:MULTISPECIES: hypothetical protein [unclassified Rathayibacter]NQX03848.1 hypothetical protein [Rathayibacter sp. VKM Ac-2858]NQX19016.1 hypothetical protein [Rathayibacter sp. VKM Ac-2856]